MADGTFKICYFSNGLLRQQDEGTYTRLYEFEIEPDFANAIPASGVSGNYISGKATTLPLKKGNIIPWLNITMTDSKTNENYTLRRRTDEPDGLPVPTYVYNSAGTVRGSYNNATGAFDIVANHELVDDAPADLPMSIIARIGDNSKQVDFIQKAQAITNVQDSDYSWTINVYTLTDGQKDTIYSMVDNQVKSQSAIPFSLGNTTIYIEASCVMYYMRKWDDGQDVDSSKRGTAYAISGVNAIRNSDGTQYTTTYSQISNAWMATIPSQTEGGALNIAVSSTEGENKAKTIQIDMDKSIYGKPVIQRVDVARIPASGGSVSTCVAYYTQSGLDGERSKTITFAEVKADSLGTTIKQSEFVVKTINVKVTENGQTSDAFPVDIYQEKNVITNSNYLPERYTASVSIGSGMTPAGGTAKVTCSAWHQAYNLYTSGEHDAELHQVSGDGAKIAITANGNGRFTLNGDTITHKQIPAQEVTDKVVVSVYNTAYSSTTAITTAEKSITNTATDKSYNASDKDYWASLEIDTTKFNAGYSTATFVAKAGHTHVYYWLFESGAVSDPFTSAVDDTTIVRLDSNIGGRFSIDGKTLKHASMQGTTGTDTALLRCINGNASGVLEEVTINVTNRIENSNYLPSGYTGSISIGSGMTASGGSASISYSAWHSAYNLYSSGYQDNTAHQVADTASAKITSNGNNRFSLSGTTITHVGMGTNETTDKVVVSVYNNTYSTATAVNSAEKSITNAVTDRDYNTSESGYWAELVIGAGITAGASSASLTATAGHTHTYYWLYTSGSTSAAKTSARTDTAVVTLQANGNNRFTLSADKKTLSHSSMTSNVTTDTATIRAVNGATSGVYVDKSVSATNSKNAGTWKVITAAYTNAGERKYYTAATSSISYGKVGSAANSTITPTITISQLYMSQDVRHEAVEQESGTYTSGTPWTGSTRGGGTTNLSGTEKQLAIYTEANFAKTFTSSDTTMASVDSYGKVTALKANTTTADRSLATITMTFTGKDSKAYSATAAVTQEKQSVSASLVTIGTINKSGSNANVTLTNNNPVGVSVSYIWTYTYTNGQGGVSQGTTTLDASGTYKSRTIYLSGNSTIASAYLSITSVTAR